MNSYQFTVSGLKLSSFGQNQLVNRYRNYGYASSSQTNFGAKLKQLHLGKEN